MSGKNKCKDLITSIDESLYLDYSSYTWWIELGATIHVVNYLQRLSTGAHHLPPPVLATVPCLALSELTGG
jgi:hypothetical protein